MSGPPLYSVVIPTYNRLDTLPQVLAAVAAQEGSPRFEVVVVDDGSSDGTGGWLREQAAGVRVIRQPNRGPAAARNRGVEEAQGHFVAFLGDDTVPARDWLRQHEARRRAWGGEEGAEIAVIGYTSWHPRLRLTPFLRYVNEQGLQFGYALIENADEVPFNFFYTSNLSLPRGLLLEEPFDLGFPYAAWEDIEVSYRLTRRHGLRLVYAPLARVEHDHPTSLSRFASRQEKAGYCAVVFFKRHPELGPFLGLGEAGPPELPSRRRQLWQETLARALEHTRLERPELWEEVLRYHYIRGLRRGWEDLAAGAGGEGQPVVHRA